MNLIVNSLKHALADLVKAKGIKDARVENKVNARGELVVAVIIKPQFEGEFTQASRHRT